ncbi:DNA replication and repair protein RecF [Pilibacter termitis]|uniref:DNA replication and repair protein RecF n=1 Tax=Pilibacter termitis TaxID=263852 RepID=A0A1T4Q4U1_9ENTE|nr:DNA replication/repair protein RecF [Pilibacter termitis]SJZ98238.1 DNA replication and repair protein RecF [Pilibacter termitis]
MLISHLHLQNYRNYQEVELDFSPSINIFLGENAQGKTNLLESLYVLALTKSHRTNNEKELIYFKEKEARLTCEVVKQTGKVPLEIRFTPKGRRGKVNHIEQKKLSQYIGKLNVILFAPEDLELVKGTPSVRRKFLDMEISQVSPIYLYDLVQYQRLLKQRNQYLKQTAFEKRTLDELYLDILDEQLAEYGEKILQVRREFVQKLEKFASVLHANISNQKEKLHLEYHSTIKEDSDYLSQLKNARKKDVKHFSTSVGIHRDDLLFFVNELDVASFGSQGQQRTTALSVKLAEIDLMYDETGEYPLLLLDDVMSELDNERQLHLLEAIQGKAQTFITTTTLKHLENLDVVAQIFEIEQGAVKDKQEEEHEE